MSRDPAPSRPFRLLAVLFELLEGRRSVRSTVHELQQVLRADDPALERLLGGLERQRVDGWAAALEGSAATARAAGEEPPGGAAEPAAASAAEPPLAAVVRHPSSRGEDPAPGRSSEPSGGAGCAPHDYSAAFSAVAGREAADAERVAAERTRVARELKRLLAIRSPRERAQAIESSRRPVTRSPLLVEGFLEEACRVRGASAQMALGLTETAILVARDVHPRHGRALCWRLQQRAEAHRANILRLLGELPAADAAWRRINEHVALEPIAVPDEEAELLSLEASLRIDLRQFKRADVLLVRAEELYREVGDWVGVARVLMMRGTLRSYSGDPAAAIECQHQVQRLLDPIAEQRLYLMSRQNQADSLVDLDRAAEAAALLAADAELPRPDDDPAFRLRQDWIEGRIAASEGRREEAGRLFLQVRNGWLSHQRPYEAALATLDLAELDLGRGDWPRVKQRAALLAPLFQAQGVHREAQAALLLCQQAANAEHLTAEFLTRLRHYLRFAPRDPRLRFNPGASPAGG